MIEYQRPGEALHYMRCFNLGLSEMSVEAFMALVAARVAAGNDAPLEIWLPVRQGEPSVIPVLGFVRPSEVRGFRY